MNENLLPLSAKHAKGVAILFSRFCKLDAAKLESFLEALFATSKISYGELAQIAVLPSQDAIGAARSNGVLLPLHPFNLLRGIVSQVGVGTAVCDSCGSFPINPVSNQLEARDTGSCPVCSVGLLGVEGAVSEFTSWVTGGKVPVGTLVDQTAFPGVNLPLTLEGVTTELWNLCQKDIDLVVSNQLEANSVTVLEFLQFLASDKRQFRNPLECIEALGNPAKFGLVTRNVIVSKIREVKVFLAVDGSRPVLEVATNKNTSTLDLMCRLLPSQFDTLLFKLNVPTHYISNGPQASRATEVLRYMASVGRSGELEVALGVGSKKSVLLTTFPFPWSKPEAQELANTLTSAYSSPDRLRMVMRHADLPHTHVNFSGGMSSVVFDMMTVLVSMGKLEHFVKAALNDAGIAGYHAKLRALTGL